MSRTLWGQTPEIQDEVESLLWHARVRQYIEEITGLPAVPVLLMLVVLVAALIVAYRLDWFRGRRGK